MRTCFQDFYMHKFKCIFSVLGILFFFFFITTFFSINSYPAEELIVSAAESLKDCFRDIGNLFEEKTPGAFIRFNFGASGILQKQIEEGAPIDVFASAAQRQMDELELKDLIVKETRHNFAQNQLVLITPVDLGLNIESFKDLGQDRVKRIAIGNPKTVPVGQYAEEVLKNLNLWNGLQPRFVFGENVRQVLNYVVREEVEAGMVYKTDVSIAKDKVKIVATAPPNSHAPILYPIAVTRESKNEGLAKQFIHFILSSQGQLMLKKYGFMSIE